MEIYEIMIGGLPHQVQLTKEQAEKIGAKPFKAKPTTSRPAQNKARTGKVKVHESSTAATD